jgi:hypothetical protein
MKDEKTETTYTDKEVSEIIAAQQIIYALDDAITAMVAANRPETFIKPLYNLRMVYAKQMTELTSKGAPPKDAPEKSD